MWMRKNVFEDLAREIFVEVMASLPPDLRAKAAEVSIATADRPTPEQIELTGGGEDLVGLYEGIALPDRRVEDSGNLPDLITLFRLPLLASCDTRAEIRREIRITILHELGHYFGFEEGDLEDRGL